MRRYEAMHFEMVEGCQLSCVGCPVTVLRPKVHAVALDTLERCLVNLGDVQTRLLRLFNYGEPFLHPDLVGALAVVQRWGRAETTEISTNGQIFDADVIAGLMAGGLTRLVVSCDGDATKEQFEALRPPARWERLMAFLHGVAEIRNRVGAKTQLWTVTITAPEFKDAWLKLLKPIGWTPDFRGWAALPDAKNMTGRSLVTGKGICYLVAGSYLYVNAHGEVVPCCAHPKAAFLGDLTKNTLAEVFDGPDRAAFLANMTAGRRGLPVCRQCEH